MHLNVCMGIEICTLQMVYRPKHSNLREKSQTHNGSHKNLWINMFSKYGTHQTSGGIKKRLHTDF